MKKTIEKIIGIVFVMGLFTACNKETLTEKAVNITIVGYNTSSEELEVSLDTVVYKKNLLAANNEIAFGKSYAYFQGKAQATLRIKEKMSGKEIFNRQITFSGAELEPFFNFLYVDGKEITVQLPVANPSTNKLGFYVHYPPSSDALDIFMKNNAGELTYLAKNVKPGTWVYTDYMAQAGFKEPNVDYPLYFTKAGTTNNWAFGTENLSKNVSQTKIPRTDNTKGVVQAYFVTPNNSNTTVVRLFNPPK
jgi:hypothetical protein